MEAKTKIDEKKLRSEFEASQDLQAEFGDVKAFVAYRRALAEGRINCLNKWC